MSGEEPKSSGSGPAASGSEQPSGSGVSGQPSAAVGLGVPLASVAVGEAGGVSAGAFSSVSAGAPSGVSTGVAGGVSTSTAAGAGGQSVLPAVIPLWCSGRANKGVLLCMSPRRVAHEGGVIHTRRWQVTAVSTWCCHNTVVGVCHQQQEDWLQRSQRLQHHLCVT